METTATREPMRPVNVRLLERQYRELMARKAKTKGETLERLVQAAVDALYLSPCHSESSPAA